MYPAQPTIGIWDGTRRVPTASGRSTASSLSIGSAMPKTTGQQQPRRPNHGYHPPQQNHHHLLPSDRRQMNQPANSNNYQNHHHHHRQQHQHQQRRPTVSAGSGRTTGQNPQKAVGGPQPPPTQAQQQQQRRPLGPTASLLTCSCCKKPLRTQFFMPACCKTFVMCENCATEKFGTTDNPRCPACRAVVTDNTLWELAVKPVDPTQQTSLALQTGLYQPVFVKTNRSTEANLTTKDLCHRQARQFNKLKQSTQFVVSSLLRENKMVTAQRNNFFQQAKKFRDKSTQITQQSNKDKADLKLLKQKLDLANRQIIEKDNIIKNLRSNTPHPSTAQLNGYYRSGHSTGNSNISHTSGSNHSYPQKDDHPYDEMQQNINGSHHHQSNSNQHGLRHMNRNSNPKQPSGGRSSLSIYQGQTNQQYAGTKRGYHNSGQGHNSGGEKNRQRIGTPDDVHLNQNSRPYSATPEQLFDHPQQQQQQQQARQASNNARHYQTQRQPPPQQYVGNPYSTSRRR